VEGIGPIQKARAVSQGGTVLDLAKNTFRRGTFMTTTLISSVVCDVAAASSSDRPHAPVERREVAAARKICHHQSARASLRFFSRFVRPGPRSQKPRLRGPQRDPAKIGGLDQYHHVALEPRSDPVVSHATGAPVRRIEKGGSRSRNVSLSKGSRDATVSVFLHARSARVGGAWRLFAPDGIEQAIVTRNSQRGGNSSGVGLCCF